MKPPDDSSKDHLDFVVDSEIRLRDIVFRTDLTPFFEACLSAGACGAAVMDEHGSMLKAKGSIQDTDKTAAERQKRALYYEGEQVGTLCLDFPCGTDQAAGIADLAAACMQILIPSTAKRLLATALHTSVVNLSYAEVLDANVKLQESEKKYRELAEELEQKVLERTSQLKTAHARMLQQEKMASIGQLAAGVAHEINNPLGYITSNLNTFDGYMQRIREMFGRCRDFELMDEDALNLYRSLKIDFILDDAPDLIRQSRDGAERVRKIVANLKGFSHIDDAVQDYVDINEEIDRTISVLEHEGRDKAVFIKHYGQLPKYLCNPGLLCQVFLNIIQNALQATELPVQIMISTSENSGVISVNIEDDGPGIPEAVISRIFEPFFTTREVGKGTGLGLSIAYDIIKNHGGEITVRSVAGEGSCFMIRLPAQEQVHV